MPGAMGVTVVRVWQLRLEWSGGHIVSIRTIGKRIMAINLRPDSWCSEDEISLALGGVEQVRKIEHAKLIELVSQNR